MNFKFTKNNLNFNVYTVAEKPSSPGVENDIAIITSVSMPNWIMSPDEPSGIPRSDGDVWIRYSVTGNTFNALKNNSMMIATISAWQYVSGAWVDVTAMSYQGGEWVEWILYYYHPTLGYNGQWISKPFREIGQTNKGMTCTINLLADSMEIVSTSDGYSLVYNDEIIDFSNLSKLTAVVSNAGSNYVEAKFVITDEIKDYYTTIAQKDLSASTNEETIEISLDGINSKGYIGIYIYCNSARTAASIKSIKME